jgi:NAD(P)-dependent dehydrogenase (short-subunit alcohol dehydrogenase family)
VLGLVRSAAVDLGPRGIRVSAVAPGRFDRGVNQRRPEKVKIRIAKTAAQRWNGRGHRLRRVLLASSGNSWITGECIQVDGGLRDPFSEDLQ